LNVSKTNENPFHQTNILVNQHITSIIIEKATPEDLSKFYNENFYMIYGVFLDTFQAYEASVKKGNISPRSVNVEENCFKLANSD
jgi:hypothetical protein